MMNVERRLNEASRKFPINNALLIVPQNGIYSGFQGLILAEHLGLEQIAGALTPLVKDVQIHDDRINPGGWAEITRKVHPDLVGFSCNYTADVTNTLNLIRKVRNNVGRESLFVVGGHHATHRPEDFLNEDVDVVVLGEGEKAIQDIIKAWNEKHPLENVPGIWYKNQEGKFVKNPREKDNSPAIEFNSPHMDNRPSPRRDLVEKFRDKYHFLYYPNYLIETQRGCANKCSFCSVWPFYRGKVKAESPSRTIQEIISLGENAKYVNIVDDSAFLDIDGAEKIADELIRLGIKKRFWTQTSAETIWPEDPEKRKRHLPVLKKLAQAGWDTTLIGFESFKPEEREAVNKKSSIEQNIQAIHLLDDLGVRIWPGGIVFPKWTKEDFDWAIKKTQEFEFVFPQLTNLTPLPGSVDYKNARKNGLLLTDDPTHYNFFDWVVETPNLTPEQMRSETLRFYRETGAFGRTPDGKLVNLRMAKRELRRMKKDVEDGITTEAMIAEFNKNYTAFLKGEVPQETVIFDAKDLQGT